MPEDLYLLISSLLPPRGTGIAVYTRAPFSKTPVFTNVITFVVNIFFSHVVSFNNRLQIQINFVIQVVPELAPHGKKGALGRIY
jgi:hypothetical protein